MAQWLPLTDIVNLDDQNNLVNSFSFGSIICHSLSAENCFSFIKYSFWGPFDSATRGDHTSYPSPVVVSVSIAKSFILSTEVRSGQVKIVGARVCVCVLVINGLWKQVDEWSTGMFASAWAFAVPGGLRYSWGQSNENRWISLISSPCQEVRLVQFWNEWKVLYSTHSKVIYCL